VTVDLSVVTAVFNEAPCLGEFYTRTTAAARSLTESYEIVFVDDGSTDDSLELLLKMADDDSHIRVLSLSRNFGHQAAITAGLEHATGNAVVVMDSDLQDPPELIPDLWAEQHASGANVVTAVRTDRPGESLFKRGSARLFYRLMGRLSDFHIELDAGDFRLIDRPTLDVINGLPERHRFVRGLAAWVGYEQSTIPYVRAARTHGETKYPLRKQVRLAATAVTSFSLVPLQIASVIGMLAALVSIAAIPVIIALRLLGTAGLGNQTTVLVAVTFFSGVQLMCLGICGAYIGRISDEVKRRPVYLIALDSRREARHRLGTGTPDPARRSKPTLQ
jgi:dolichol-phosphate mannosyltransferase